MADKQKILLDTNYVIAAYDTGQLELRETVRKLMLDQNVELAITPLIRFEVLNKPNISETHFNRLDALMGLLRTYEIRNVEAKLAAQLLQKAMHIKEVNLIKNNQPPHSEQQKKIAELKLRFDAFHVASAAVNGLNLLSEDLGIQSLKEIQTTLKKE